MAWTLAAIGVIIAGVALIALYILTGRLIARRRRRMILPSYKPVDRNITHEPPYQIPIERLKSDAYRRRLEEEDTAAGTPVWFSRTILNGNLDSAVIAVSSIKCMVQRTDTRQLHLRFDFHSQIDEVQRRLEPTNDLIPGIKEEYVCLIGWTRHDDPTLREIYFDCQIEPDNGGTVTDACAVMQAFADKIVSRKALDWPWFSRTVMATDEVGASMPHPPLELVQRHVDVQQELCSRINSTPPDQRSASDHTLMRNLAVNKQVIQQGLSDPNAA